MKRRGRHMLLEEAALLAALGVGLGMLLGWRIGLPVAAGLLLVAVVRGRKA